MSSFVSRLLDVEANPVVLRAVLAGVLVVTALAYSPVLDHGFVNWDDPGYVTANPTIGDLSAAGLVRAFTSVHMGNYHPLAMLSLAIDAKLGGFDPRVFHATSLVLHLGVTALVYPLLTLWTGHRPAALAGALLFGLHPLHVESVAWISERKDVLYAFFFVAALLVYSRHAREPRGPGRLALTFFFFLLSVLSKGQAVALVPTLVAVDYWAGRPLGARRVWLEKLPFLVVALVFGAIALGAQQAGGQLVGESQWSLPERFLIGAWGLLQYVRLLLVPTGLSAFHPYPPPEAGLPWAFALSALVVVVLAVGVLEAARRGLRSVVFAAGFFFVNVALVLQVIPVGGVILADRYVYVASIGYCFALVAGGAWIFERSERSLLVSVLLAVVLFLYGSALGLETFQRTGVWRDSLALWNDVLARYPLVPEARLDRALALQARGDLEGAIEDLSVAIRENPRYAKAWNHRGVLKSRTGDVEGALADLSRALILEPSASAYSNRGAVHAEAGDPVRALVDFDRALDLEPTHVAALTNRARSKLALGRAEEALGDLERAVQIEPGYARAWTSAAEALDELGRHPEACSAITQARLLGVTEVPRPSLSDCP